MDRKLVGRKPGLKCLGELTNQLFN